MILEVGIGSGPNPTSYEGLRDKETIKVVSRPVVGISMSFNICDFECPYVEPKFAEDGPLDDNYKNDFTDILIPIKTLSDSVEFKLFKCDDENAKAILDGDLYGTYFPPSVFPDNLKYGFIANWNLILAAFGTGQYYFQVTTNIIGDPDVSNTWTYDLQIFTEEGADGTVRVQTKQTGFIKDGIDYSGFVWSGDIRFRGSFGLSSFDIEKIHYQTPDRVDQQNRDKVGTQFKFEVNQAPYQVIAPLMYDKTIASDIFITSYKLRWHLPPYVLHNVVYDQPEKPFLAPNSTMIGIELNFSTKNKTPVKTNG